jgi:hypothetical protein
MSRLDLAIESTASATIQEVTVPDSPEPLPCGLASARRLSHEPPPVVERLGWRYHHIGIPTTKVQANELHLERFGLFVSGFTSSPYGIEWMRFELESPIHELIRTVPHVAFEVDDLEAALEGQHVIYPPGSPSEGVRSAMIVHNGAPVELISFQKPVPSPVGANIPSLDPEVA